jgi:hypothetical protein
MKAFSQPLFWYDSTANCTQEEQIKLSAILPYRETSTVDDVIICIKSGEEKEHVLNPTFGDTGSNPSVSITESMKPSDARISYFRQGQIWALSPAQSSSKCLVKCLFFKSRDKPENVTRITDAIGEKAKRVIGTEGAKRIQEFKLYEKGWDSGKGERLSSMSVAVAETFLNLYPELSESQPSVFLTRSGNLQLGWEDQDDNPIEVEFFPNKVEYYIGSRDEEGEVQLDPDNPSEGLQSIIAKVQILCHE